MTPKDGRRLVVAFFEHPAAADAAVRLLQRGPGELGHGGTVGVLSCDDQGRPAPRLGPHGSRDDGDVGTVLGRLARALTGRDPPAPRVLFGTGSDLSSDDLARFAAELEAGQALVAVLARRHGAERAALTLIGCGGRAELHWIAEPALDAVTGGAFPVDQRPVDQAPS